jgi:hypothetical protein
MQAFNSVGKLEISKRPVSRVEMVPMAGSADILSAAFFLRVDPARSFLQTGCLRSRLGYIF